MSIERWFSGIRNNWFGPMCQWPSATLYRRKCTLSHTGSAVAFGLRGLGSYPLKYSCASGGASRRYLHSRGREMVLSILSSSALRKMKNVGPPWPVAHSMMNFCSALTCMCGWVAVLAGHGLIVEAVLRARLAMP